MNTLTVLGNLGQDAQVQTVADQAAINFSVASLVKYKDKAGIQVTKTTWFECTMWRKADNIRIAEFLKAGEKVLCIGEIEARSYLDKDGQYQGVLKFTVREIHLTSPKQ